MDWFLYDNGLRHEMVKHFGSETRAFVQKTQLVPLNPFQLLKVTANLSNTGNKFRLSKKRTPLIYGPNFLNQRRLVLSELTVDKTATHYVEYNLLTFFDKSCVV